MHLYHGLPIKIQVKLLETSRQLPSASTLHVRFDTSVISPVRSRCLGKGALRDEPKQRLRRRLFCDWLRSLENQQKDTKDVSNNQNVWRVASSPLMQANSVNWLTSGQRLTYLIKVSFITKHPKTLFKEVQTYLYSRFCAGMSRGNYHSFTLACFRSTFTRTVSFL